VALILKPNRSLLAVSDMDMATSSRTYIVHTPYVYVKRGGKRAEQLLPKRCKRHLAGMDWAKFA
jgi:hypothetical protein